MPATSLTTTLFCVVLIQNVRLASFVFWCQILHSGARFCILAPDVVIFCFLIIAKKFCILALNFALQCSEFWRNFFMWNVNAKKI